MIRKFWLKLRFLKILIKIEIFRNSSPNLRFPKIFTNIFFLNFGPNPDISKKVDFNHILSKILTKTAIFGDLDSNRDVSNKIEIYRWFWSNLKFSPIVNKIASSRKFCPKSRFSKILTKIEVFRISLPKSGFQRFWPKSLLFENFDEHPDFSKVWHQLRFFENLTKMEMIRKFWPKCGFFVNFD